MNRLVMSAIGIGSVGGCLLAGGLAMSVLGQVPPATNPSAHVTMPLIPGMATVASVGSASPTTRQVKDDLLGKLFNSTSAGIAFKPPAASRMVQPKSEDQFVEFDSDLRPGWVMIGSKMPTFKDDTVLTTSNGNPGVPIVVTDPPKSPHASPTTRVVYIPGVLEQYLEAEKRSYGVLDVFRSDTINAGQTGTVNIGVLAFQYTIGGQRQLKQVALVQSDPRNFFVLDLTTPGSDNPDSPLLQQAAATFSQMMDSIVLVDQSPLLDDQNRRILHTEALYGSWTEAGIDAVLLPQRYLRIIRDDKDVGYVYATEKPFKANGMAAVRIAMRIHNQTPGGATDSQTIMISTVDYHHSHEQWQTLLRVPNLKNPAPDEYSEIGATDYSANIPVPVAPGSGGGFKMTSKYTLTVTGSLPDTGPEHRDIDLPPFYLPQALQYLLPRIIQHSAGKGGNYMFYSWVPSTHEVMALYCDVLPADRVRFNGQMVTAFQVKTHIGLQGPVTTDYIDNLTGKYLGAQSDRVDENNKTTQEIVVPCDADTLTKIWTHPNLTDPGEDAGASN
jgi:hypothetical protein